jgi:hypothetical protein
MARFRDGEFQLPDHMEMKTARERRTREFIRMKYVDKRWIERPSDSANGSGAAAKKAKASVPRLGEEPQLKQLSEVLPDIGTLVRDMFRYARYVHHQIPSFLTCMWHWLGGGRR